MVNERVLITEGRLVRVTDRLRVLRQVARLRLVEQLRAGEATPQELADTLGLTQQNVSKHLQDLGTGLRLKHADVRKQWRRCRGTVPPPRHQRAPGDRGRAPAR
jgi:DNA-binding transcriptional ArsR family regulator